jgi:hypothetical protein
MTYPNGWTYVKGPIEYVLSTTSSTATFVARNPVTLTDDRTVFEADSDSTAIFGIAAHDAADSLPGNLSGMCLVEIPTADTIYAIKIGTAAAASEVSAGQSIDLEKSGNYIIGNEDSQTSPMVTIVPRGDGTTLDSADSTVYVHVLGDTLGVFSSQASIVIFGQN